MVSPPIARGRPGGPGPGRPSVDGISPASRSRPSAPDRARSGRRPGEACRGARQCHQPAPRRGPDRRGRPAGPGEAGPPRTHLGKDHWQTGDARRDLETYRRLAGLPREVQDRYAKARQADARANQLYVRGQYAEAALLFQETLTIRRDILGEDHPDTADSYSNLAETLRAQGKHAEAEAMHRRALAIWLKVLGEGHPDTAISYNNLAATLLTRGSTPRPRRCTAAPWRSSSRPWARTTPTPPPATTTWP